MQDYNSEQNREGISKLFTKLRVEEQNVTTYAYPKCIEITLI